jgi:hypothetical protein
MLALGVVATEPTTPSNHTFRQPWVTVYARALGVALAQKSYDTLESSERAALKG